MKERPLRAAGSWRPPSSAKPSSGATALDRRPTPSSGAWRPRRPGSSSWAGTPSSGAERLPEGAGSS
ncbi:hypothetical protein APASM_6759 [Actinosynnema pretiosum subsp. pretiosum]|nr:hypothetical protein APASM_6759 [Actinosynnema pretiosum subsp. pretiosum]